MVSLVSLYVVYGKPEKYVLRKLNFRYKKYHITVLPLIILISKKLLALFDYQKIRIRMLVKYILSCKPVMSDESMSTTFIDYSCPMQPSKSTLLNQFTDTLLIHF